MTKKALLAFAACAMQVPEIKGEQADARRGRLQRIVVQHGEAGRKRKCIGFAVTAANGQRENASGPTVIQRAAKIDVVDIRSTLRQPPDHDTPAPMVLERSYRFATHN